MRAIDLEQLLVELDAVEAGADTSRAACFDADHTLWCADLGDDAFQLALQRRSFREESKAPLAKILSGIGEETTGSAEEDAIRIYAKYKEGHVSEEDIIRTMVVCFAGWSIDEVRTLGREVFRRGLEGKLFEHTRGLFEGLRSRGIDAFVVSGTAQWLVEAAVEPLGVNRAHVLSARAVLTSKQTLTGEMDEPLTYKEGKLEAIRQLIGDQRPLIGFGDSLSDLLFLQESEIAVAINPRPGLRSELGSKRTERTFSLTPARTEDGTVVTPHDSDRII